MSYKKNGQVEIMDIKKEGIRDMDCVNNYSTGHEVKHVVK
jgi:hypothetical protein